MRDKISKRTVDQLKPGQSLADTEVRGFRARRLASGALTYEFRYRGPDGKRQFIALGIHGSITADEARGLAKKRAGEVADLRDPAAEQKVERTTTRNTVNAVLDQFIEIYVQDEAKLRSAAAIKSIFDRLVRPQIGADPVTEVKREDIVRLLDKVARENGVVMADRSLAYLRKAFNWYSLRNSQFNSPIIKGMARTRPGERKRERVLTDVEIRDLWTALDQLKVGDDVPACYPRYMRAVILSGQRRLAVSMAHRDEVDGADWIIPAARMKRGRDHRHKDHLLPVTPALAELLGKGRGFLFSSDGGKTPFSGFSKAKAALDKKIALMRQQEGRKSMPHWTLHDLRRTGRTIMSRYATPDIAERVIGHVIGGVRATYDLHGYADEKRAALEALARHVDGTVQRDNQAA